MNVPQLGSAGIFCEVCGRVADAVTEHRSPGPLTVGLADKAQPRPQQSRCYAHGLDRCWTSWKVVSDAAMPPNTVDLVTDSGQRVRITGLGE